jgi:lambda family phage portal protein
MNVGTWKNGEFKKDKETNRTIEQAWEEAGLPKNCTVRRDISRMELYIQAVVSIIREGGWLAKHVRGYKKNKFYYGVQPQEIDRLDHFWMGKNPKNGNTIKFSIELDEYEAPVAYWLRGKHPGEIYYFTEQGANAPVRIRYDANDIIAFFDLRTRAEQLCGISRLASIISRLHRIDQFDIAHMTAAIWSACKPMFMMRSLPTVEAYLPEPMKQAIDGEIERYMEGRAKTSEVAPGEVEELPYGFEPKQMDPKFPIEAASDFKKEQLRAAAAGSATSYHEIGQDLESVNFSSARVGLAAIRDGYKILQKHAINMLVRPHFEEWLRSSLMFGAIKGIPFSRYEEIVLGAKFYGRRWEYLQPLHDAQADMIRLQMRTTSRDRIIADSERGGDYEGVAAELDSDNETDKAHKLQEFNDGQTQPTEGTDHSGSGAQDHESDNEAKEGGYGGS